MIDAKPITRLGLWLLQQANAPPQVWDFVFELAADILSLTSRPSLAYGNQPGYKRITNLKPDISQHASFGFYDWIWHWDEVEKVKQLGRWLGVAENVGRIMTFWILNSKSSAIPRSTITSLSPAELDSRIIQEWMAAFNNNICSKFKVLNHISDAERKHPGDVIDINHATRSLGET